MQAHNTTHKKATKELMGLMWVLPTKFVLYIYKQWCLPNSLFIFVENIVVNLTATCLLPFFFFFFWFQKCSPFCIHTISNFCVSKTIIGLEGSQSFAVRISFILSHICFLLRGVGFCCCLFFTFVFSVACLWSKRHIGVQCLLKEDFNNARVSWGRAFIFRGTTGACWGPAFIY